MKILIGKNIDKPCIGQRHELCFQPHQLFLGVMLLHDLDGLHVLLTGRDHAVHLVIAHAVHVMATGGEKGVVHGIEIGHGFQQLIAVGLGIVVLVEGFGKQQLVIRVIHLLIQQQGQSAVGLYLHQGIDAGKLRRSHPIGSGRLRTSHHQHHQPTYNAKPFHLIVFYLPHRVQLQSFGALRCPKRSWLLQLDKAMAAIKIPKTNNIRFLFIVFYGLLRYARNDTGSFCKPHGWI